MDGLFLKLFSIFFFIVIGFTTRRRRILNDKIDRRITWLVTSIFFPCLVFNIVYTNFTIGLFREVGLLFFLAIAVSIASYFLGYFFAGFLNMHDKMRRVFLFLSFKPANVMIGVPLCIVLLGKRSLLFSGPYSFGIGIIFYTLGLGLLKGGSFSWHSLVNPISMAILASVLLAVFKVDLPGAVLRSVGLFGILAVPMALIVVGSIFGMLDFKKGIIDRRMFLVAFNKLIFAPILIMMICVFLPIEPLAKKVAVLMAATPSSLTASMWALHFDADHIWASSASLFVGISSILTISLVSWLIL